MEEGILTDHKDEEIIQEALTKFVKPRGYKEIKANLEEFDTPSKLSRQRDGESYIPDITAVRNGRKNYFEIVWKSDQVRQTVTKWKLLSNVARFKRGKFFLMVPRGHYAFASRILDKHQIQAELIKL